MVLGTIIAIIVLAVYGIAMTISKYKEEKFSDEMINDYSELSLDYAKTLLERDTFKEEIERQKDIIADLSRQINKATVKTKAKTEKPKKEAKEKTKRTTTTKKTTTRKTTTKKKEVK